MEKEIKDFERYIVYDDGRVWSKWKKEFLKPILKDTGYYEVQLWKKCKRTHKPIHKLVAEAFIPNPENKPCIDHKNGDRTDNRVENLRWCTQPENNNFEVYRSRQKNNPIKSKIVYQYTLDGELVNVWPSTMEAQRNGFDNSKIGKCCLGKQLTHKGYKWSYIPL